MLEKKEQRPHLLVAVLFIFMGILWLLFLPSGVKIEAANISLPAKVVGQNVYVRKQASLKADRIMLSKKPVMLGKGQSVKVLGMRVTGKQVWYQISFVLSKKEWKGYIYSQYVKLYLKKPATGVVSSKVSLRVRKNTNPGTYLYINRKSVLLKKGQVVSIIGDTYSNGKKWFSVSFSYLGKRYKGYIEASGVNFSVSNQVEKPDINKGDAKETVGVVMASTLNVRTGAGTTRPNLTTGKQKVQLAKGTRVTILGNVKVGATEWLYVSFAFNGERCKGYVCGSYVHLETKEDGEKGEEDKPEKDEGKSETEEPDKPEPSEVPSSSQEPEHTLNDKEFEQVLEQENFPESYKKGLMELHERYPLWEFKANQVDYDWDTVIAKESMLGKNLISNAKSLGWKSMEEGAYRWDRDSFVPFDGYSWVTASKEAIEYYMDPRNFLTTDGIFQFEYLSYMEEYQKLTGVEAILGNTVLHNKGYTYQDGEEEKAITYGETLINAAQYSKVNPYHLATRVKQEVVTSRGLSSSVSGTVPGYEGYYNFFNIGAYHSTKVNGAVINGLRFAKTGNGMSDGYKKLFKIPWNNPYNALVGGAKYIGNNYIARGQNTIYLQKFNLSSYSTFNHQYMANVEAAKAEAQKVYGAYQNVTDVKVVFHIPVFKNMPEKKAPIPQEVKNPNNWLKTLTVEGKTLTPSFQISNSEDTTYTVFVDRHTTSVKINATSVCPLAQISGTGVYTLSGDKTTVPVHVTAENGHVRTYVIYIVKKEN